MKRITFLGLFFLVVLTACDKETKQYGDFTEALIVGQDFRRCIAPICGGWFIEVGSDTLRFLGFPEKTDLLEGPEWTLPMPVLIKYEPYSNPDFPFVTNVITLTEIWRK